MKKSRIVVAIATMVLLSFFNLNTPTTDKPNYYHTQDPGLGDID